MATIGWHESRIPNPVLDVKGDLIMHKSGLFKILLAVIFTLVLVRNAYATDISDCTNLNSAGTTYYLTTDILNSNQSTCMTLGASNVVLDCQGHQIQGNGTFTTYGIFLTSNSIIRNCVLTQWYKSMYTDGDINNLTINNVTSTTTLSGSYDVYTNSISNSVVYNSYFTNTNGNNWGGGVISSMNFTNNTICENSFHVALGSSTNPSSSIFKNNTFTGDASDYLYHLGSGNVIDNNTFVNGGDQIIDNDGGNNYTNNVFDCSEGCEDNIRFNNGGNAFLYNNKFYKTQDGGNGCGYGCIYWQSSPISNNTWNTTTQLGTRIYGNGSYIGGNWWGDVSPTCADIDRDGFCDQAFNISTHTLCTVGVDCGTNVDYYPLSSNGTSGSSTHTIWQSQGENVSSIHQGDSILLYAQGKSDYGLDYSWLETNETGAWQNKTSSTTLIPTAHSCNNIFNCDNSADGNFATYGYTNTEDSPMQLYENYTIPTLAYNLDYTCQFHVSGTCANRFIDISFWNYSSNSWENTYSINKTAGGGSDFNLTVIGTTNYANYFSGSYFRTMINDTYPCNAIADYFYECQATWKYPKPMGGSTDWVWSNYTWSNSSIVSSTIGWRIWYNDTTGYANKTDILTFTTNNPPQYSSIVVSPTSPVLYGNNSFWLNITWTDPESDSITSWVTHNFTGSYANYSMSNDSANHFYYHLQSVPSSSTYYYFFYANDTYNNHNQTSTSSYVINKAFNTPTFLISQSNFTVTASSTITNGDSTGTFAYYLNGTLYNSSTVTSFPYTLVNTTTLQPSTYVFNFTYNSQNYSSYNSQTHHFHGFWAYDYNTSSPINNFNVTISNGSASVTRTTSTGEIMIIGSDVPQGSTTVTFSSTGYASDSNSYNFNTFQNISAYLHNTSTSSMDLCARDIQSNNPIVFSLSITNGTNTVTFTNKSCWSSFNYTQIPLGSITITFSNGSYSPVNILATNGADTYNNITAYMLGSGVGAYIRFHILTYPSGTPIIGALGKSYSDIGGVEYPIDTKYSDGSGTATFFMNQSIVYNMTFSMANYQTYSGDYQPTQTDYYIYLTPTYSNVSVTGAYYGTVNWLVHPSSGYFTVNETVPINFTYNDYSNITYFWGLNVTNNGILIYNEERTTQSGIISLNLNMSGKQGNITLIAYANRSYGGYFEQRYNLMVTNVSTSYNIWNILKLSIPSSMHPMIDFIGLLVVFLAIGFFSKLPWHLMGSSIFGLVLLGILMYLGIVQLSAVALYNWLMYVGIWIAVVSVAYLWKGI